MVAPSANAREKSTSSGALVGAAVLFLMPGLLFWPVKGIVWDTVDVLVIAGTGFFLVMAVWARWSPVLPAAISIAVYFVYFSLYVIAAYQSGISRYFRRQGILDVAILAVLVVGLVSGVRATRRTPTGQEDKKPAD